MYDLTDTTFIIPIKIETKERLENLWMILYFLTHNFDTNIIVNEQGDTSKSVCESFKNVTYMQYSTDLKLIHKTKLLNDMLMISSTPIVSSYDCDVLFYPQQYVNSVELIRHNEADLVLPFDKYNLTITRDLMNPILQNGIEKYGEENLRKHMPERVAPGGCAFVRADIYKRGGGENEYFIAYGPEDEERLYRFRTLGYRVVRINGNLFHIEHPRTINSMEGHKYSKNNWEMWNAISRMDKEELEEFIKTWEWYEKLNK